MPSRLFFLAIIVVLLVTFIGFNVENRCDISLAFYIMKDVPVVLTILSSFALGLVAALPFALRGRKAKNAVPKVSRKQKRGRGSSLEETPKDERFPNGGMGTP